MREDTLNALRSRYKTLPVGVPETSSGLEGELLKALFTEEEACAALQLTMAGKTAKEVADGLGKTEDEATELLEGMVQKVTAMRRGRGDSRTYHLMMFLPGTYDYWVDAMDEPFAHVFEKLYPDFVQELTASKTPIFRVIPTEGSLPEGAEVAPHEQAYEIVANAKRIALAECVCRRQQKLIDHECDRFGEQICVVFGGTAQMYIERGIGKEATVEEAHAALERGRQAGLVRTATNIESPLGLCQCCPDCCMILRCAVEFGRPSVVAKSNFVPAIDKDACEGCPDCVDVCPMKAMSLVKGKAKHNGAKCFGCGMCVGKCGRGAISMRRKAARQVHRPLPGFPHLLAAIAKDKGRALV